MLRVLNILYDERIGGPQLRVLQVAKGLRERGVETIVVMPTGGTQFAEELAGCGIGYVQVPLPRPRAGLSLRPHLTYLAGFWPSVRRLRAIIRDERIDVVHNNGIMNWQGAIAARRERVPLVWHLNDVNAPRVLAAVGKVVLDRTASVVAVSAEAVAAHLFGPAAKHPRLPTHVLYAPVETGRFAGVGADRKLDGHPRIGTVGNLNPWKGHRYLVEAIRGVVARHPDARFFVVGAPLANRPRLQHDLERAAARLGVADHISFLGSRSDIPSFLAGLDIYVHPSLAEACPIAVLEAMAAEKPIVATDVGGTSELVPDGVAATLVPKADPEALAQAINSLLDDPSTAASLAAEARKRAVELFDVTLAVAAHERIYGQLVANGPRAAQRPTP